MTKSEISLQDTAFIGPGLLFLDQYFNSFIDEYVVLWIALVSILLYTFDVVYIKEWIENRLCHSTLPFQICSFSPVSVERVPRYCVNICFGS